MTEPLDLRNPKIQEAVGQFMLVVCLISMLLGFMGGILTTLAVQHNAATTNRSTR